MLNLTYKKLLQDKVTRGSLEEYFSLIESALSENRTRKRKTDPNYIYYECHHILPRSLFPELIEAKDNKVLLTAREHFIAHKLLFDSIPCQPLGHALWKMACCNKDIASVTPEEYEEARLVYLSLPRWNKGRKTPDETKKKISNTLKQRYKETPYVMTEEHHKKCVETRKRNGYKHSKEHNEKVSKSLKGRVFVNNGIVNKRVDPLELDIFLQSGWLRGKKPLSEEHKKNIGKSRIGKPAWNKGLPGTFLGKHHSEEAKIKMREAKIKMRNKKNKQKS